MRVKEALAEAADNEAVRYLQGRGFRILDRNWRCDSELVSILAAERGSLVVIELRVRAGTRHGTPLGVIAAARRQELRRLAARWISGHGTRYDRIRIDVVGLVYEGAGGFTVEHVRAVG